MAADARGAAPENRYYAAGEGRPAGVRALFSRVARRYDLTGAVILQVERGSVADRAGLRGLARDRMGRLFVNDVITAVDKIPVKSYDDFFNALESYKIGDEVSLTVEREKKTRRVTVALTRAE